MIIKTMTWNIGGGKLLEDGKDPGLMSSYSIDGIELIAAQVKANNLDIIAIQEAHGDDVTNQVEQIAKWLGYTHYFYDAITDSHVDANFKLGNGLISKFPISSIQKARFLNPKIHFKLEDKQTYPRQRLRLMRHYS